MNNNFSLRLCVSAVNILVVTVFALASAVLASSSIDLSKAANMGVTESFDEAAGAENTQEKNGLKYLPIGSQTFRGIPFQILDSKQNQGRSFIVLKGRRKPDLPEGVSIPAGHLKAAFLYFLHTCRWGGTASNITVAEYDIVYDDGQITAVPLRVGLELTNYFNPDDTSSSFLAWWHKYKNIEMGVNLFPWKNPHPEKSIQSILFKSRGNMPVPMLFAITASDKELPISPISPKPEKELKTDTSKWIPFESSAASPAGTAIDMSFLLDAPAGKHGKVKADGEELIFEDGTPAKFWGIRLSKEWTALTKEKISELANRLSWMGCNLILLGGNYEQWKTEPANFKDCLEAFKAKGIYVSFSGAETVLNPLFLDDPALIHKDQWREGGYYRGDNSDSPSGGFEFISQPMVMYPEESTPFFLSYHHYLGSPYRPEWRNGWPNEYLGETPLMLASYCSFAQWPAIVGMNISCEPFANEMRKDMDISNKPSLFLQWPIAALACLRSDLKPGKLYTFAGIGEGDIKGNLKVLAHRSGIPTKEGVKTDRTGELRAKINEKTKSFVTDTGQITWQGNVGVVKVEAPRFQALIGFLSHRKFNNPYWAVETPNSFASLSAISLTNKAINVSDHILLTGVTRMENTGMVYNQAKTKLLNQGTAPILIEPLNAKMVLYRFQTDPKLKIRALDVNGHPLKTKVSSKWVKNSFVFSWVPSAFYLEIFK